MLHVLLRQLILRHDLSISGMATSLSICGGLPSFSSRYLVLGSRFAKSVHTAHSTCQTRRTRGIATTTTTASRPGSTSFIVRIPAAGSRSFAASSASRREDNVKHVFVRCKSSGSMIVSMYNVSEQPPTTPLLLYLPPSPQPHIVETEAFEGDSEAEPESFTTDLPSPPDYLLRQNIPIVSIRYRWSAAKPDETVPQTAMKDARSKVPPLSFLWPTPLHDVAFAYDWIKEHLAPPPIEMTKPGRQPRMSFRKSKVRPRRDLYVYGSHLGASLATSLSLTESHTDQAMAIRGVATYNGIYNWMAFVKMAADGIPTADDAAAVRAVAPGTPPLSSLFAQPADLFDTFVSPCLFFRTPGLVVPPVDFDEEINRIRIEEAELELEQMQDRAALDSDYVLPTKRTSILTMGMSQKSYIAFPPLQSTLKIPSSLLLHTLAEGEAHTASSTHESGKPRPRRLPEAVHGKNSFSTQADEMASLLCRGIDRYETKRRKVAEQIVMPEYRATENESEADTRSKESEHRVRQVSIGSAPTDGSLELGEEGQQVLLSWLDEHMKSPGKERAKL